jgi:hypothetical protein
MILWPRDQLPVEELEHTLLRTVMRRAGVIPNIWNRAAVARALHWAALRDPERKKRRGPPCKQTYDSQLSIDEMHRRTLTIALRIARTNDAKTSRSAVLAALRFFRRHETDRRVGRPMADRSRLGIVTAVLRRPREKNVRAIANRIAAYGDPAFELRRLEDFVADFIGTRRKKRKKPRPIKLTDRQKLRDKRKKRLKRLMHRKK